MAEGKDTLALALELGDAQLDVIAQRAAAIVEARPVQPQPWLDVDAAARHLGYGSHPRRGRKRIYDLVARNELPCKRDGRRLLFRPEWLDRYLEQAAV